MQFKLTLENVSVIEILSWINFFQSNSLLQNQYKLLNKKLYQLTEPIFNFNQTFFVANHMKSNNWTIQINKFLNFS